MKITLIYAGIFEGNNVVPPLGIMTVAAVLEKGGYKVQVLDIDPEIEEYLERIRVFNPDMIGLGFLTTAYPRALKLLIALKGAFPNAKFFCGGPHATALPEQVLKDFDLNFVVKGEGELTALEACDRIRDNLDLKGVKGLIYRENGEIVDNGPRPFIEDLDSLPFPARHLVDYEKRYLTFPGVIRGKWLKSTIVIAGRGCPFSCRYCAVNNIFGRRFRLRSVENVISEIKFLVDTYHIRGLYFIDSSFTINKKWVIDFSRALVEHKLDLVWGCNSRVDTLSEEMLAEMKKAGCIQFDFGVESGSDRILKILNKKTTVEQAVAAFRMVKKAGMRTGAYFMLGNEGETREEAMATLALAKKIRANYTVFFYTTPFPGTGLYDDAISHGWLPLNVDFNENWAIREADYPVMTVNFTAEELKSLRARFQNRFFARNYLNVHNLKIILTLLWLALKNPGLTWGIVRRLFKIGRLDTLAEAFLTRYRLKIIKG